MVVKRKPLGIISIKCGPISFVVPSHNSVGCGGKANELRFHGATKS